MWVWSKFIVIAAVCVEIVSAYPILINRVPLHPFAISKSVAHIDIPRIAKKLQGHYSPTRTQLDYLLEDSEEVQTT